MSQPAGPELPRLKGRGRIAPAGAAPAPPAPRRPWGPSLRRLGIAAAVVAVLVLGWCFRERVLGAAPLLAGKLEDELTGLFDAFGKLVAGVRPPVPGAAGTTGPVAGAPPAPTAGAQPDPRATKVAGPNGQVLTLGDLLADLRPGTRYRLDGGGLELVEGGVMLRFPRAGASVGLRGGYRLTGGPGLAEVRIEPDATGTVDALGDEVRVRGPGGTETRIGPLERWSFPEPDSETYPSAEAETFLKRSAWLAAGKSGNPRLVAQDLARRSLDASRGTDREALARRLLELASAWAAPGSPRPAGTF